MHQLNREHILARYKRAAQSTSTYTWFNYQPINLPGFEETMPLAGRNCFDRAAAIARQLQEFFGNRRLRVIDWGCNLGFFCFELAKLGHEVVGVDRNAEMIDICRHLATVNDFPVQPQFYCAELKPREVGAWSGFDVALSFSVFHHLGPEKTAAIRAFAEAYPAAFVEMDGAGYGYNHLFPFYWHIAEVVETNDRFSRGTRCRKTWFCSNAATPNRWRNIKAHDFVYGRGTFRKACSLVCEDTVVKRELLRSRHSWIATNLEHEIAMYRDYGDSGFFPRLIGSGATDRFRWMEIEYVEDDGSASLEELRRFFEFLRDGRLFLLDVVGCSFLFRKGRVAVVDLESLFPIESTIADLIRAKTGRDSMRLDDYEKQLQYVSRKVLK